MPPQSERLTILSEAEYFALYGLPDFDERQRLDYLSFSEPERTFLHSRPSLPAKIYCGLQIGYFKAKQAFFPFSWEEAKDDCAFLLSRCFPGQAWIPQAITKHERYAQRHAIAAMFGFRLWNREFWPQLAEQAARIVRRDAAPAFIATELITFLNGQKIVRPGHTTLQTLVSEALSAERRRLGQLLAGRLDESARNVLKQLLVRDDTLAGLAALKQDAKHFGYRQMALEREKRATLEPVYRLAKALLPDLAISRQNVGHYASLAHFYTIYDLRRLRPEQACLYLLCYAWQRYRQLTDNLVDALGYHMKQIEDETKAQADRRYVLEQGRRQEAGRQVGNLLLLYVDDTVDDATPFGVVRQRAFSILPKEALQATGQSLSQKPANKLAWRWQLAEELAGRIRRHLRPLFLALDFASTAPDSPWLAALAWMKGVFTKAQRLSQRPLAECPDGTVPSRLRPYLLEFDADGNAVGVHADRYEFWIYRQVRKRLKSGEIHLDDSLQYRRLADELVSPEAKAAALGALDIPWLRQPAETQIEALELELHRQWQSFDRELRRGKLKHLDYDSASKTLTWHRPKADRETVPQAPFFDQVACCDIADVFRFVNERCRFLAAMTPLQPRYAKQAADPDSLMAVILAQAMNHGNRTLAETCDIPYHVLEAASQQYLRVATLQNANDLISNAIAELPIFPHYSFDLETLYGSVDGQKFGVERPTIKARHSRKYFGRGKGVVAYTLLCSHVPLQSWLIGAHEFEAHHVFDLWYRNTSEIVPTAITGDMHSVNKANFAILHWFGSRFEPRFTDLKAQIKQIYCTGDPARYDKMLIRPAGAIDVQAIADEKAHIDQIVATLALKEMTQGTLIRKLCTYTAPNPTRRAIFEFDKLVRSIYTLRYLRDLQLQRNVHRSQNRIESYHQLRSAIAQVGGKKELTGRTDLDIEISNQCGRLVANAIIYYNSAILSRLMEKHEASSNPKILALLKRVSPAAWRHIHLNGHYTFRGQGQPIDLDAIMARLVLK